MYADNTLTPREAIRLCALGTLAQGPLKYDDLVHAVRHFVGRITGPSLELMGDSIELLKFEGLAAAGPDGENPKLTITADGRQILFELLNANVRSGGSDLNELILALKFRFLHLLPADRQATQIDIFIEVGETELARLEDLRRHHDTDPGHLTGWLDQDIHRTELRLDWLTNFRATLP